MSAFVFIGACVQIANLYVLGPRMAAGLKGLATTQGMALAASGEPSDAKQQYDEGPSMSVNGVANSWGWGPYLGRLQVRWSRV